MESDSRLLWIIAIIFLFCAMFCAITEISFASASRVRVKAMADAGNRKAKSALFVLDNFEKAISTILICTNIFHISIASLVTLAVTKQYGLSFVTLSTILTTLVVFFAGEMLPKSIAKRYAESVACFCARPLRLFMVVFSPLSALLSAFGNGVSKLVKGEPELSFTEEELDDIIEDMTEDGTLDSERGDLISSALHFGERTVESVLTPRVDVIAIDRDDPIDRMLSVIKGCSHSRLPVYEGSIDHIIGILQIRRFMKSWLNLGNNMDVSALLDEPMFVHQSAKIDDLLPAMSKARQNLAIVTDNYGGTLGIVSVEDMVEELVGEIWDEDDVIEEAICCLEDGSISADADEHVSDAFDKLGFDDPENDDELVDTVLGAWAFENFESIPAEGDSFIYHNLKVTVLEMDHNRIKRLRLAFPAEIREGDEDA